MGQAKLPINLNPFSEASVEAMTQRARLFNLQVARNRNGLTRGRKRHKKQRRALAIRKLLQMSNPPIFIDPQGDSDLIKKMLQTGLAQGRKEDYLNIVFKPSGMGKSFFPEKDLK